MSKPEITDLPIWAEAAREKEHKEHKDKTHGKNADGSTGDPDPSCCIPPDPDPGPDGG